MSQQEQLNLTSHQDDNTLSQTIYGKIKGQVLTELPDNLYIPPDALKLFLESFEGPFDLLLYLIRGQKLDLNEISVAAVTDQYMQYVEEIRSHNIELASDYLLMAADLTMLKSRILLPRITNEDKEGITFTDIPNLLEEYEKIQKASLLLNALPKVRESFWIGNAFLDKEQAPEPQVLPQEIARIWMALSKSMKLSDHHKISRQELSIHEFMSDIVKKLSSQSFVDFTQLLSNEKNLQAQIVCFLAILELAKNNLIDIIQAAPYAPIYLSMRK